MKTLITILFLLPFAASAQMTKKDSAKHASLFKFPTYGDYRKEIFYAGLHMEKATTYKGYAIASGAAGISSCIVQGVLNNQPGNQFSNTGFYVGGGLGLLGLVLSWSGNRHMRKAGEILYFSANRMPQATP